MRYITLVAFVCLQLSAFAEDAVLTKASVIKTVIEEDTKQVTKTIKCLEGLMQIKKLTQDGAAKMHNNIIMLKARVKENNLILKSKDAELRTTRATFLVAEKLNTLYKERIEARKNKSFEGTITSQIKTYLSYMKVLNQD